LLHCHHTLSWKIKSFDVDGGHRGLLKISNNEDNSLFSGASCSFINI
jgi:hypothetical protein